MCRDAPDKFTSALVFTATPVLYISVWIGDRFDSLLPSVDN